MKGNINYGKGHEIEDLIGYIDNDLGWDTIDKESMSGVIFFNLEGMQSPGNLKITRLLFCLHVKPSSWKP